MKPPAPKRRGPPRKRVPVEAPPVSTRLICLAGDMNDTPEGHVKVLSAHGFLEASSRVREEAPDAGTFEDGRWIDYVFIKPALRPQGARVVFNGGDLAPVSDHYGVAVEFEV
ncbi:MAG: endonuclease/exonuclease/phosphatase family protein [Spirochaetota bacterium]